MSRTFQAAPLRATIAKIIQAAGSSPQEAKTVADNLVLANLSGHDSHGVGMVPRYVDAVLEGGLKPNASVQVQFDGGSLLALDGQRGYGQVVGEQAMTLAIQRAQETGSCVMALAHAHHLGRIGHFAEMAVARGLVSIHFVNVQSRPVVAPFGGGDGRYGTNPFTVGIPLTGREPFVLDFATSRVAQGKMRVAHNKGETVAPGLLVDDRGQPTTAPRYAVDPPLGAIMPFGEHKGYGLAVACELLGGALTGSGTENGVSRGDQRIVNGMLSIVIDPTRVGSGHFAADTRGFLDWLRGSPPAAGFDRVRIAGEPELEIRERRLKDGIPVDPTTWRAIGDAAVKLQLAREVLEGLAHGS